MLSIFINILFLVLLIIPRFFSACLFFFDWLYFPHRFIVVWRFVSAMTVDPFSFQQRIEGFYAGIVLRDPFLGIAPFHFGCQFFIQYTISQNADGFFLYFQSLLAVSELSSESCIFSFRLIDGMTGSYKRERIALRSCCFAFPAGQSAASDAKNFSALG